LLEAPLDAAFEDHAPASNAKAATATDVAIRAAAQHATATADAAQIAKPAAGGFFGLAGVREDRRAALEELREAVERVRGLEAQAARHSPLFGEWKPPEGAREAGRDLAVETLSYVRHKDLDKGVEGEFVEQSSAFKAPRGREAAEGKAVAFDALKDVKVARAAGDAASAIQRVVEEAKAVVRPAVAIASRALAKIEGRLAEERGWERLVDVGLADAEFRRTFNVAGRPLYFVYTVGDVEFGAVKATGVKAVAFLSGKKTLRIEILAEGVEGLAAKERVSAWGGEWLRLATFQIDTESGVVQLIPRVDVSARVVKLVLAERLSALVLTDVGKGGEYLESPDPMLHLFYALAVGEVTVRVARVVFTETGPVLHLEGRTSTERINWLYEEVARELKKLGVKVGAKELRRTAKSAAVEAIGEYAGEVKRIAREARGVEELRARLVELFDRVAREAAEEYRRTGSEEARWRAVGAAVAKKFFAENVDDPVWWTLLLLGDGVVKVRGQELGFSAVPTKAAETVMYAFARVMGVPLEVRREGEGAVLSREASRAAVERLFKRLEEAKVGDVSASQLLTAVAEWWLGVGTGGSTPPKLLSLLALRELAAGKEGKWLEAWLSYEAAATLVPEEVERWLEGVYRVSIEPPREGSVGFDAYFERGGERFKLHTDFTNFYLNCEPCDGTADGVLRAVASALGVEKPRWEGGALVLPAEVGWPMFLKLWARHNVSLRIENGGRELLRVEVLEARANGFAKFRLWYYKWRETRPDKPYVDVEITYRGENQGFRDLVSANVAEGILRGHLAEIADLLKREGVKGVSLITQGRVLKFSGRFRDSVLRKLSVRPELPPGEPPAVQHSGGFKLKIGDREVEFGERVFGKTREFYAELKFPSEKEAVNFARSLMAIGVDARVASSEKDGYKVRLDSDAFFGLLAHTGAVPPGFALLYRSDEGDFRIYASVEEGRMRFYFAVRHGDAWRAVEGLYGDRYVPLRRKEREVLEAIRSAVAKALEKLGRQADVEEPGEIKDKEGNAVSHYLILYGPHLKPFLEHAAEHVEVKPAEVRLEGRRIAISTGGIEAGVEFKLLKRKEAVFLPVQDVERTLALYKSLREVGVPVEITPEGVKIDGEVLWGLAAAAVERNAPSVLPAEVMPGIELLKVYNAGGMRMYVFRVSEKGIHYYFAVKAGREWRAAGGKLSGGKVDIAGEAAVAIAEAINALYSEMGVDRRVEVKYDKRYNAPYIRLTNVDLELLGLKRR